MKQKEGMINVTFIHCSQWLTITTKARNEVPKHKRHICLCGDVVCIQIYFHDEILLSFFIARTSYSNPPLIWPRPICSVPILPDHHLDMHSIRTWDFSHGLKAKAAKAELERWIKISSEWSDSEKPCQVLVRGRHLGLFLMVSLQSHLFFCPLHLRSPLSLLSTFILYHSCCFHCLIPHPLLSTYICAPMIIAKKSGTDHCTIDRVWLA